MGIKKFQYKLWRSVNECRTGALRWSETGDSVIFNMDQFKTEYLEPNNGFSKSTSVSSFIRQLNLYGFRKISDIADPEHLHGERGKEYGNPNFLRDRYDLLVEVTRSSSRPIMTLQGFMKKNYSSANEEAKNGSSRKRKRLDRRRRRSRVDSSENTVRRSSRPKKPFPKYSPTKESPTRPRLVSTEPTFADISSSSPEWDNYFHYLLRAHDVPPPTNSELHLAQAVHWRPDDEDKVYTREESRDVMWSQSCGVTRPGLCQSCTDPVPKQNPVLIKLTQLNKFL